MAPNVSAAILMSICDSQSAKKFKLCLSNWAWLAGIQRFPAWWVSGQLHKYNRWHLDAVYIYWDSQKSFLFTSIRREYSRFIKALLEITARALMLKRKVLKNFMQVFFVKYPAEDCDRTYIERMCHQGWRFAWHPSLFPGELLLILTLEPKKERHHFPLDILLADFVTDVTKNNLRCG